MDTTDSASGLAACHADLSELYEKGLYRQAFDRIQQEFGQIRVLPTPELQILLSQIHGQLGLVRISDAMIFRLWRASPETAGLAFHYISAVHRWHGPLEALGKLSRVEQNPQLSPKDQAYLATEKIAILCGYRDFSAAETILEEVSDRYKDRWIEVQRVQLRMDQDKYDEALSLARDINARYPGYRVGLQKQAYLEQLLGQPLEAINTLEAYWSRCESWWVGSQLFDLYVEQKDYEKAADTLTRLEKLPPLESRENLRRRNAMQADLLCAQQKYDEALPYLEQKSLFGRQVSAYIKNQRSDSRKKVLDVPFVRQAKSTCAPASLTAVSHFWGVKENQDDVIQAICYGGTQAYDERKWALSKSWFCCEFDLEFDVLKNLIDNDIPVLLATVEPGTAHLQIIVGYDESMQTYILRDPWYPRLQEFLIKETQEYYAANGPRCLVIAPQDKAEYINSLALPMRELYDRLYLIADALYKNNRKEARLIIEETRAMFPDNRLTLFCERALAIYDRDDETLLRTANQLLERFPDNVNFQLSKISCLMQLGSSKEALSYIESLVKKGSAHFLIRNRLANELRWDHRQQARTDALYRELLKQNPTHVETLYGYAGTLWDKGEFEFSYQLYRFCACLEDTNERYAESYFKAARFHKQTDIALDFLRARFQQFGEKSSGPAMSLYSALDSLNNSHEALEVLEAAIEKRPNDGDLLLFSARKYAYSHQRTRANELLLKAKDFTGIVQYNEAAIDVYEAELETDKALDACTSILQIEPLNSDINHTYSRLLTERNQRDLAVARIRDLLGKYPENAMLQKQLIYWTDPEDPQSQLQSYLQYIASHPMDAWARKKISALLIECGDFNAAVFHAEEATKISRSDSSCFGYYGDALLSANRTAEAREAFKTAIKISCDYSYAFSKLLQCSVKIEKQREDLEFIYEQLMQQVSYGEGILEFQFVGKKFFESARLENFLLYAVEARPDLWQSWVALAIHYREHNACEKALHCIESAVERFPLLPRLHLEKAEILRLLHDDEGAIAALEQALALSPGWIWAANNLSDLYEKYNRVQQIIDLQQQIIRRNPLASSPRGYLADAYVKLDRTSEAITALEEAVKCDPDYRWGWRKLYYLLKEKHQENTVVEKLLKVIRIWPKNADLLETYAELAETDEAIALIEDYLELRPFDIDMCIKLIQLYASKQDYDKALHLASDQYWNNERPTPIVANEAWIHARKDNLKSAIAIMERVANADPNYYDAWRYLTIWYCTIRNKDGVTRTVAECARLYPHDVNVLCFCAEKLEEVGGDKQQVVGYLKHAFELDPGDQYNGLTYIDHLLDATRFEEAQTALERLLQHQQNIYVYYRGTQIALKQKSTDKALEYFKQSVYETDEGAFLLYQMWDELVKAKLGDKAASVIQEASASVESINPFAGKCLGNYELNKQSFKRIAKKLRSLKFESEFDQRYLEAFIRFSLDRNKSIDYELEKFLTPHLKRDTVNWGLYGYKLFVTSGRENQAAKFLNGVEQQADVKAWNLYFASMAYRWVGDWSHAAALMRQAWACEADSYRNDILIWYYTDLLLAGEEVEEALLEYLNLGELEPMSHYALAAAKTLRLLNNSSFYSNYQAISPCLRVCQRAFQGMYNNQIVRQLKASLRRRVNASLPQLPFLKTLFWNWRISNHF